MALSEAKFLGGDFHNFWRLLDYLRLIDRCTSVVSIKLKCQDLSSPRAESARAVTGKRCPHRLTVHNVYFVQFDVPVSFMTLYP